MAKPVILYRKVGGMRESLLFASKIFVEKYKLLTRKSAGTVCLISDNVEETHRAEIDSAKCRSQIYIYVYLLIPSSSWNVYVEAFCLNLLTYLI